MCTLSFARWIFKTYDWIAYEKEKKTIEQKHKRSLSRFSHVSDNFENLIARIVAIILIDDDHETITTRKLRKLKTKIEKKINTRRIFSAHFFPPSIWFSTMEKISFPIWISRIAYKSLNHNRQHHSQLVNHKTCNHSLCWNQVQF